jgi:hypothetical protein
MSEHDIGLEILECIRDIKAYKAGTKTFRVHALKQPASFQWRIPPTFFRVFIFGI